MLTFLPILLLFMMCSMTHAELFRDFEKRIYEENKWKVDRSAATICYVVGGTLEEVKTGKPEYGFTCDVELRAYSDDKKEARDMCESTFPHYVVEAEQKGHNTRCKFVILNRCPDNYYLIYEKCYLVLDTPVNYQKAKEVCETGQGNKTGAQLAEYSSSNLGMDLLHMEFLDVWVEVPDLNEHFANDKEEGGAVFAVKDSWKYERKEGVLLMEDLDSKHRPLCEYTPPKTLASLHWILDKYNGVPGFPIFTKSPGGFSVDTKDLCPLRATNCWDEGVIGGIFGIQLEKPSFNSPTTRSFNIPKAPKGDLSMCPQGWLRYERTNGQIMCHGAFLRPGWASDYGTDECLKHGAHLTGFESEEEVEAVFDHFSWLERHSYTDIGGTNQCNMVGCNDRPKTIRTDINGKKVESYNFGWLNGVSSNLELLYQHMWYNDLHHNEDNVDLELCIVTTIPGVRKWQFRLEGKFYYASYICGKYADF